jgi:hypothetical protein
MSQNDLVIANQSFPATRADINSALQALGSLNSGTTEPATTYANMFWYDTTAKVIKLRSEANDAWISIGYFDQSANAFRILDDTQVTDTSGTQTGLLGDQSTATWETGTGTTQSLVSPANVKASVVANAPVNAVGVGQTWQNVSSSRTTNTVYTNTTGRPIMVVLFADGVGDVPIYIHPSGGGSEFVIDRVSNEGASNSIIVPAGDGYEIRGTISTLQWSELK